MCRNLSLHFVSLTILIISGCGTGANSSLLGSDDDVTTISLNEGILDFCERYEPDFEFDTLAQAYCAELDGDSSCIITTKRKLSNWSDFISEEYFRSTQQDDVVDDVQKCVQNLVNFAMEIQLGGIKRKKSPSIHSPIPSPYSEPNKCWVIQSIETNGCLLFSPCRGNFSPDYSALPISDPDITAAQEQLENNGHIKLCRADLSVIHTTKDPNSYMKNHNNSFFNMLTMGHLSPHKTYGAANCHGTAQHLSGNPLAETEITKLTYHSTYIEKQCHELAQNTVFNDTSAPRTLNTLPIRSGGVIINMDHGIRPDETGDWSCGEISLQVESCTQSKIDAHLFINGMTLPCWSRVLGGNNLSYLATNKLPKLSAGCVLTQSDHSIKLVYTSNDICYYYESAAPYAAPHIRASACHALAQRFDHSWCPDIENGFIFDLQL